MIGRQYGGSHNSPVLAFSDSNSTAARCLRPLPVFAVEKARVIFRVEFMSPLQCLLISV
jgi:hypothetical protein